MIQEHDLVAMLVDRAQDGLRTGDVGAIVHCYAGHTAFEVEFLDENGHNKCVATIPSDQLMKLNLLSLSA
jgi:hypothetical protein